VLKWKMNPAAIKPAYLTKGYDQRIDFKQEAAVIARYRDRTAYFESYDTAKIWTSAAFPEYPYQARRGHIEGVAYIKIIIGPDGRPTSVQLAKSSGNTILDNAALSAVRLWRAHKEFAGAQPTVPIRFTLQPLR